MLHLTQQVSESVPQTAQSMWLDNFVTFSMLLCNCAAAHFGLVQYCRIRESHREVQRAGLRKSKATVKKLTDTARRHGLAFLSLMQKFVPQERMLTQAELDEKERLARAEEAMADALDQADEEVGLEVPLEPLPEWPLPASAVLVETPPQIGAGGVAQAGSQVSQQTVTEAARICPLSRRLAPVLQHLHEHRPGDLSLLHVPQGHRPVHHRRREAHTDEIHAGRRSPRRHRLLHHQKKKGQQNVHCLLSRFPLVLFFQLFGFYLNKKINAP
mmetsp:Transcript_93044/g.299468  ORF Transcript_93044/g.299468 Transcript_93044/m.299468 type:complete len:271 (-) Transcript_93044:154-966(-)